MQFHHPVENPEFRYQRSKNPYWDKLAGLRESEPPGIRQAYLDGDTEARQGLWRESFPDQDEHTSGRRPLHVELGCNGGHVLLEWAKRNPEDAYLGLDWKFKQIFLGREKAMKREIPNAIFLRGRSERLQYIFDHNEIDHLYLFFPDPWPKDSQKKHRYFTAKWLETIAPTVRPGGTFEIRTDHADYAQWMMEEIMKSHSWELVHFTRDRHGAHPDPEKLEIPEVTLFERIWIRDKIPIHLFQLRRA